MDTTLKVGARASKLSQLQTSNALALLQRDTGLTFALELFSSPGDRDRITDLRQTPGDFFTSDLDAALLDGTIDLAIHSAKDLPEEMPEGIDWFWLPWREDARDALVARTDHPQRFGVSSGRREAWVRAHFPNAECLTLRGDIPSRLAQLDAGDFDAILVAQAALVRLGLEHRATRILSHEELPTPPGQGVLAVTFRAADPRLQALRNLYLRAVRFVGAGAGDAENATLATLRELSTADCIFADALLDSTLQAHAHPKAQWIAVGKRSGAHSMTQAEITSRLLTAAKQGLRVVRLKGGDPGMFGRLAEETAALTAAGIPFRVWPGVSALNAATTSTGMLLTLREKSKGFTVATPRSAGEEQNAVYFMALNCAETLAAHHPPETPYAIVSNAGTPAVTLRCGTLGELKNEHSAAPALLIVGPAATRRFDTTLGPLHGKRIWVTGTPDLGRRAHTAITDFGGIPILRPLIQTHPTATIKIRPSKAYNLLVVTSPTAARLLLEQLVSPIQYLPKRIAVTGPATANVLAHLHVDILMPESDYSANGLLDALPADCSGLKVLRVRSEEAGPSLSEALKARGAKVKDQSFYTTTVCTEVTPPPCDIVFLASSSAAKAYASLANKPQDVALIAFGEPTATTLRANGLEPTFVAKTQTVHDALFQYVAHTLTLHSLGTAKRSEDGSLFTPNSSLLSNL